MTDQLRENDADQQKNFHTKAAIVILQARMSLSLAFTREHTKKVNKWVSYLSWFHSSHLLISMQFALETDDTDEFRDELRVWKQCGGFENRPPPLIVETYLDTKDLTSNQSLVILDKNGKRWDVMEALNGSTGSDESNSKQRELRTEVILERWTIELKDGPEITSHDFGAVLPSVYKKCVVFFRSLYATTKFVPAWRFVRSLAKSGKACGALRVKCRILSNDVRSTSYDPLTHMIYDSGNPVVTTFDLGETESPAGRLHASLTYRNDCNFRVDDSEALLSSRFMGADEDYFQPSLGAKDTRRRQSMKAVEVGSLPAHQQNSSLDEPVQAYGSLSTFHGNAPPLGSSPISALRAAKALGSDTSSPPGASPSSLRSRPIQTSRASTRALEGIAMARRPSLSFQPFKAGSLSASPVPGAPLPHTGEIPPQSPQSLTRNSGLSHLNHARNRSSLTAGMPASLRGVPLVTDNAISSSTSSSPKPAPISRYSSSFSHRRGKLSYGGTSRVEDDQESSGKQSLSSSSAQPGSGMLTEGGGSSGSFQTDDDNISDFLKLLDSKKTLQSFEPSRTSEASAKRTSAQLSRFQSMRESNNVLTESMSSSTLLHRSSSSSSRQLSSVPQMVAATSLSTSSSPGKPISPHTPHTPAIPSRLSANSIAEYSQPHRVPHRVRTMPETQTEIDSGNESDSEHGTNAIDIPTSPRPYYPHNRRSSSVAQQHRSVAVDDDIGDLPFGVHRSISLGADDREPPSLNSLRGLGHVSDDAGSSGTGERVLRPAAHIVESPTTTLVRQLSRSQEREEGPQMPRGVAPGSINAPYRPRIGRMGGRGLTPPQVGSYASLPADRGSGSGLSDRPGSRYSFSRPTGTYEAEDEPLLFDMSEIGRDHSRRSLEEAHGGGSADRGGDSISSSRRGSRRGW